MGFSDEQDLPGANAPGTFIGELQFNVTVTPEPSILALAGMAGAAAIGWLYRRHRSKKG